MSFVNERRGIGLDGQDYELVTDSSAAGLQKRSWSMEMKPVATRREARPDTRAGPVEGEWVTHWSDFSKGMCGEQQNLPGTLYMTNGCAASEPGVLRPVETARQTSWTNAQGYPSINPLEFNNIEFHFMGRYVYMFDLNSAVGVEDEDFGSGVVATDAIVHNSEIVVGFDGSTNKIRTRATSGVWTTASDATYCGHFGRVEDRLWDSTGGTVRNIGPTDNPLTLANHSAALTVGDPTLGITDLNSYGIKLAVSKPDGLYLGNRDAIFDKVIDHLSSLHGENGKRTLIRGADIFFPHRDGFLRYSEGYPLEEIGPQLQFRSITPSDQTPGLRVRSMAAVGSDLYAATDVNTFPRANPTGVKFTTDSGASYTDRLTNTTDEDTYDTVMVLDSLDTLANGDWFIVGYSAAFFGVLLEMAKPNGVATTMRVDVWTGAAWTQIGVEGALYDGTRKVLPTNPNVEGTISLTQSGAVTWTSAGTTSWASSTIDGTAAFWARFSFSVALDTETEIGEIRVLVDGDMNDPGAWLLRGRPRRADDVFDQSIIWETVSLLDTVTQPTGMTYFDGYYPLRRGGTVVVSGLQRAHHTSLSPSPVEHGITEKNLKAYAYTCRHDGGMSELNKQWLSVTVKGRGIDSVRDFDVHYRLEGATAWTSAQAAITSSPTTIALSAVSGRSIQLRITFNVFTSVSGQFTEINEIEAVWRERNTFNREWSYLLDLHEGQQTRPDVQLTNLEALVGAAAVTLLDPYRRSYTASVLGLGLAESYQHELGFPALAVPVRVVET